MEKLKRRRFQLANQTLYSRTCPNGLQVFYIPKKGFTEMTAILSVGIGSIDSHYIARRRTRLLPIGIAHFLEHQLFLGEDQEDLALQFTKLGSESNAFTTFDKTNYFFSTIDNLPENLELLQKLVSKPFFTDESIRREKEIVKQEISMYQDDADFQLYKGVLANLYPGSLLASDVAGEDQSIDEMSLQTLSLAYDLFYRPENMSLVIVGDFDHNKIDRQILSFQDAIFEVDKPVYKKKNINLTPVIKNQTLLMDIVKPKLGIGFRGKPLRRGSLLKQRLVLRIFLNLLFGWTSNRYQKWYDSGYIDDSFDFEIEVSERYQFVMVVLDTDEPIAMGNRIRKAIKGISRDSGFTEENLILLKNEIYGEFIRSLDSIDEIANQFVTHLSDKELYFELPRLLNSLTLEEVFKKGVNFFTDAEMTEFTVFPK